jgi:RND family efflux transporter MFP subunit
MNNRLLLASVCFGLSLMGRPGAAEEPPVIEVSHPVQRVVTDHADFTGRLEAAKSVEVRARVGGYLQRVFFDIGDRVREGDVLFEIDPRLYQAELKKARANLDVCKARLQQAEADYKRVAELVKRALMSREELEKSTADKAVAAAEVVAAQAGVEFAEVLLGFTRPTAPFAGVVAHRAADAGTLLKAEETVVLRLITLDPIHVIFQVDERTLLQFAREKAKGPGAKDFLGLPVEIGFADQKGFPHRSKLDSVSPNVDPATGTVRMRAVLPNTDGFLKPGMSARVRLLLGEHKAFVVRKRVVHGERGRLFRNWVFIVNDKNVLEERTVDVRPVDDEWDEVTGLRGDDWVVLDPSKVRDGMKVEPKRVSEPDHDDKKP